MINASIFDNEDNEFFFEAITSPEMAGERIDSCIARLSGLSRSRISTLIEENKLFVNDNPVKKNYKICGNEKVSLIYTPLEDIDTKPENIPLDIVYEDSDLVVVNKPQGMVVHPAPGNYTGTLVNALLYHCKDSLSGINGKIRPGIVHRIDKFTSGLLIVAKNDKAHIGLAEQIKAHSFTRKYQAIIYGNLDSDEGTVKSAIGRNLKDRKKMACFPLDTINTKNAITHYKVLERLSSYAHIELVLETGRTHQIRVHMLSLGHPIVGDELYAPGRKSFGLQGQCLHAKVIGFNHPITGAYMCFDSPLPEYFTKTLTLIKKDN